MNSEDYDICKYLELNYKNVDNHILEKLLNITLFGNIDIYSFVSKNSSSIDWRNFSLMIINFIFINNRNMFFDLNISIFLKNKKFFIGSKMCFEYCRNKPFNDLILNSPDKLIYIWIKNGQLYMPKVLLNYKIFSYLSTCFPKYQNYKRNYEFFKKAIYKKNVTCTTIDREYIELLLEELNIYNKNISLELLFFSLRNFTTKNTKDVAEFSRRYYLDSFEIKEYFTYYDVDEKEILELLK